MAEPHVTLAQIVATLRDRRTAAGEVAFQDFMELSEPERWEILFYGLVDVGGKADWAVNAIQALGKDRRG